MSKVNESKKTLSAIADFTVKVNDGSLKMSTLTTFSVVGVTFCVLAASLMMSNLSNKYANISDSDDKINKSLLRLEHRFSENAKLAHQVYYLDSLRQTRFLNFKNNSPVELLEGEQENEVPIDTPYLVRRPYPNQTSFKKPGIDKDI